MKKYFLIAILSVQMACPLLFTSCSNDDITEEIDKPNAELKVWVEPYHNLGASIEEVKIYMAQSMGRYHQSAETTTANSIQLSYITGNANEGVVYTFTKSDEGLYSVIDTEMMVNSQLIIEYLQKHYTKLPASNESTLQYCFTNPDKSIVVNTMKVSESNFNVSYSYVH